MSSRQFLHPANSTIKVTASKKVSVESDLNNHQDKSIAQLLNEEKSSTEEEDQEGIEKQ